MRPDNQKGFSLIEVMVAVAVTGIILLLAYRSIGNTSEAVQQATDSADLQHTVRVILGRLAEELVSADWTEETRDVLFLGVDGNEAGRPADSLRFRSRAHAGRTPDARESDLNVLDYSLHNKRLMRREEYNLLNLTEATMESDEISDVASLNVRYWDGTAWRDNWDATRAKGLPLAVVIELAMEGSLARQETFTTMVSLPLGRVAPLQPAP